MTTEPHVHWWKISEPAGAYSLGVCDCGETRQFVNSYNPDPWVSQGKMRDDKGRIVTRPSALDEQL